MRVKKMPKVPYFRQKRDYSCGPASLRMILSCFDLEIDEEKLIELCGTNRLGTSRFQIVEAATKLKFDGLVKSRHSGENRSPEPL